MSLFDIATLEKQLQELENETIKEEFWQKSPSETGKILAQIKQLKGKVEQYNKINQEIFNISLATSSSLSILASSVKSVKLKIYSKSRKRN